MATAVPYKDKTGRIVSYQIQVFRGRDSSGKKLKPYTESWKVPETYKTEKAIKKALEKEMGAFELKCKEGRVSVDKSTLSEYCRHYIKLKDSNKKKSVAFYESLLPRIDEEIGYVRIDKLTAKLLDNFYLSLKEKDARKDLKAVAKSSLLVERNLQKLTNRQLGAMAGLTPTTVGIAMQRRNVNILTAEKLSSALGKKFSDLFDVISLGGENGLSPKSIDHYHTFLHSVLETARKKGDVAQNVADLATPPSVVKKEADFFEIDDLIKIRYALEKYPMKYRVMICILADTGIRRGELFGIRRAAISFSSRTIKIEKNIQRIKGVGLYADTPKGHNSRIISISEELAALLKEYIDQQDRELAYIEDPDYNRDGYLFIQKNGTVMDPSSLNSWIATFEKSENLPHIYPHKFRHSQASILLCSGIDLVTVAGRLGHAQPSTTGNIYGHILQHSDRRASDTVAAALYR